jgi:hypothetical protein
VDQTVGNRTPPRPVVDNNPGSPPPGTFAPPHKSPAHTPKASVVDAGSVQKKPRSTTERLGGKIVPSDSEDDDASESDAAGDDDDDASESDAAGDDDDDAAKLVSLFENPDFKGGHITVCGKVPLNKLTLRWKPNRTVYATPPESGNYTIRPTPYVVQNTSTAKSYYVTFVDTATDANIKLLSEETQTWFRKR